MNLKETVCYRAGRLEVQRRGGVLSRVSKGREAARKAMSRHASATRAAERGEVQVGNRWGGMSASVERVLWRQDHVGLCGAGALAA